MRFRARLLPLLAVGLAISACSSLGDSVFLVQNVSDRAKAQALTDAGIAAYNEQLFKREQFDQVETVKRYFATALRYDPTNATAQRYLGLADGFRAKRLRESLGEAMGLLAQGGRQEADNYQLAMDAQRAARIDRNNAEVVKLLKDSQSVRTNLAALYVSRAQALVAKMNALKSDAAKEPLYIDAFQNSTKAVQVDPGSAAGRTLQSRLRSEIADLVKRRLVSVNENIEKGRFSAADGQLDVISELNDKLNGEFDDQVQAAGYTLNYQWGSYYYGKRSYDRAEAKVEAAIAYKRGSEALALQQNIIVARDKAEHGATFEDGLKIVDAAVARGDLGSAQRSVDYLAARTTDSAKAAVLDGRRAKIRAAVADSYNRAVALYQAEKFNDAIDLLEDVVAVDPGYQQAADYLDKARAKQKLLNQY